MERIRQLQEALAAARVERAIAHAKFLQASAKAKRLTDELLEAEISIGHQAWRFGNVHTTHGAIA